LTLQQFKVIQGQRVSMESPYVTSY